MAIGSRAFCLPRRGNNLDEYEDAIALENASGRYALADGASEGCFTGLWARLLVKDFVSHAEVNISRWPSSLFAVQERWGKDVRARKLDWDADYWVEQGAFAAFLGLVLTAAEAKEPQGFCTWQAVAIGDTCLFHTRDSVLLTRVSTGSFRPVRQPTAACRIAYAHGCRTPATAPLERREWATGRQALGHDRCLGKMVPHGARGWRRPLARAGIAPRLTTGWRPICRVDRSPPRNRPLVERRRDPSCNSFVGGEAWFGQRKTTTTRRPKTLVIR